jgi:hypothetical protein
MKVKIRVEQVYDDLYEAWIDEFRLTRNACGKDTTDAISDLLRQEFHLDQEKTRTLVDKLVLSVTIEL